MLVLVCLNLESDSKVVDESDINSKKYSEPVVSTLRARIFDESDGCPNATNPICMYFESNAKAMDASE
jgi:hypothetical protein